MGLPETYMSTPEPPEAEDIDKHLSRLDKFANMVDKIEVEDNESLRRAEEVLQSLTMVYDIVEGITERFRKPAYAYYKKVLSEKKDILSRPKTAIEDLRNRIEAYMIETGDEDIESAHLRSKWRAELEEPKHESLMLLCEAIARGEAPAELVKLDKKYADKVAGILMDNMNYPGIKSYKDSSLVVRKG